MLAVRRSTDRGHFNHGWLDTYHSFSFGGYQDQGHMGFCALRVINEDFVAAGAGFGTHGHREDGDCHLCARGRNCASRFAGLGWGDYAG